MIETGPVRLTELPQHLLLIICQSPEVSAREHDFSVQERRLQYEG
jgi:hypothetical protein